MTGTPGPARPSQPWIALAGVLAAALLLAGCGQPGTPPQQDELGRYVIHMGPASFTPYRSWVPPNATVVWVNDSAAGHDVRGPDFASGPFGGIPPGGSFEHRFTEPGTLEYFCYAHHAQGMNGHLVVQ